jgi:hypothetical protein
MGRVLPLVGWLAAGASHPGPHHRARNWRGASQLGCRASHCVLEEAGRAFIKAEQAHLLDLYRGREAKQRVLVSKGHFPFASSIAGNWKTGHRVLSLFPSRFNSPPLAAPPLSPAAGSSISTSCPPSFSPSPFSPPASQSARGEDAVDSRGMR